MSECEKRSKRMMKDKNPMFGKKHTQSTLEKIKNDRRGENNPFYNKKHTEETLKKLRRPLTEEHKAKLRKPKRVKET